jgi:branched-chain amino acid transport system substrate-binding protein
MLRRPVGLIVRDGKTTVTDAAPRARSAVTGTSTSELASTAAHCAGQRRQAGEEILLSNCASDDFTGKDGNNIFRLPNITTRTQGYAAAEYAFANFKSRGNRYYTIASDFAFGRLAVAAFKERTLQLNPKAQFIGEAWPKINQDSYSSFITAMVEAKPDVVFFAWGIGIPFWQQSGPYELPKKFAMVSSYWGGADEMRVLPKESVPVGAVLGGFPWYAINNTVNTAFVNAYTKEFGKAPPTPAYFQHVSMQALRLAVEKAKTTETPAVIKALEGMQFESIVGPVSIRPVEHQGTTPHWTGKAAWDESRKMGVLSEIIRLPTDKFLRSEAEIEAAFPVELGRSI